MKISIVLLIALIGFAFTAPTSVGWIIGHELRSQLASRMNAKLDFNHVVYKFPYGVRIDHAHLLMPGTERGLDSWVDVGRLELTLAKLPLGVGPLEIEKLEIQNPTLHLSASFGSTPPGAPSPPPASSSPTQKLSDLFQLRNVSISGGRFEYDFSERDHPIPPVIWGHLNANMNTLPTSGGTYKFDVAIQDLPVASAQAQGDFNIDSLQLNAEKISLVVTCDPAQHAEQIPAQAQAVIQNNQIAGQLTIDGIAQVPVSSITESTFTVNVGLKNAHCQPSGFAAPITPTLFTLTMSKQAGPCRFNVEAKDEDLAAISAAGMVDLKTLLLDLQKFSATVQCDPNKPTTQLPASVADSLAKLKTGGQLTFAGSARVPLLTPMNGWYAARAALNNGQVQPPGWNGPVSPAKFSITASNAPNATADSTSASFPQEISDKPAQSHLWLNGLSVACGDQLFKITGGEIAFNPVDKSWTARKFLGVMDVGDGPGPLEGANTRIYMPFIIAGDNKQGLRVALDDGSAVITPNHIHVNRINGMMTATAATLRSSNLVAKCAEGQIQAVVNLDWKTPTDGPPISLSYDGNVHVNQLDLHQLAMEYTTDPAVRQQAFGQLDLSVKYRGSILQNSPAAGIDSVADRFAARGDMDITHGHFIDIPILRDLLLAMNNPGGATVGEAAATFDIAHSVVTLDHTGASSPVIGIQGNGTITFDQKVDMNFIATPLADWAKDAKGTGLIGEAGAAIFGKAQDVVNGLQGQLYQFRVVGDLSKPKVNPIVAPFLTDKMSPLFQKMAGSQSNGSVAEELKKEKSEK